METSGILTLNTNTVLDNVWQGVDQADLTSVDEVNTGSTISSFYMSCFFIAEKGDVASEVPLVDWYVIKDAAGAFGTTFDATHLPTPGNTGAHANKRFILHTEKGLAGGGTASLAGVPMIFKGVIRIPKGMRRVAINDRFRFVARSNFNTKFCSQFIYKWYS